MVIFAQLKQGYQIINMKEEYKNLGLQSGCFYFLDQPLENNCFFRFGHVNFFYVVSPSMKTFIFSCKAIQRKRFFEHSANYLNFVTSWWTFVIKYGVIVK